MLSVAPLIHLTNLREWNTICLVGIVWVCRGTKLGANRHFHSNWKWKAMIRLGMWVKFNKWYDNLGSKLLNAFKNCENCIFSSLFWAYNIQVPTCIANYNEVISMMFLSVDRVKLFYHRNTIKDYFLADLTRDLRPEMAFEHRPSFIFNYFSSISSR